MELLLQACQYILENPQRFTAALSGHLLLSLGALLTAAVSGIALGVVAAKRKVLGAPVMGTVNTLRVIPGLAILAWMLPVIGTGSFPAWLALMILGVPPIVMNTYLGFRQVPADILEAGRGMGMDAREILLNVEFPLAMPSIVTGLRTAAVEIIAGATLAAFIGGGGLGVFIINGLSMAQFHLLLVGAIPVILLTLGIEALFSGLSPQKHMEAATC